MTPTPTTPYDSSFDLFWNLYAKKKSRDKVERKWYSMSVADQTACMDSLPSYIKSTPDKTFRKHPITYLNQKCWNDEIYTKGSSEENILYKMPEPTRTSPYQPPPFDPQKGKQFIVNKIKLAYEGKCNLHDVGSVYTRRLKRFLECDPMLLDMIKKEVQEIVDYVPPNRREEKIEINVELEVRNRVLRYNMDRFREANREIWREL